MPQIIIWHAGSNTSGKSFAEVRRESFLQSDTKGRQYVMIPYFSLDGLETMDTSGNGQVGIRLPLPKKMTESIAQMHLHL